MSGVNYKNFHDVEVADFDAVVVGCGFAGAVCARELADKGDKKVLIIEKRNHIGGNMYDEYDEAGILVHKYGPHIFHTSSKIAADFIKEYSMTIPYEHRVKADIHGTYMPVPFNKTSMEIAFGAQRANELTHKLIKKFGDEVKVTINELRSQEDKDLAEIADYVYENVFLHYTEKQWGLTPEEVDPSVTARVPIFISRDDRYFQDRYQFMPKDGYTKLFENVLDHKNITVALNTEAESVFGLEFEGNAEDDKLIGITIQFKKFDKPIIYTGPLDELFLGRFGRLPYRSLDFKFETLDKEYEFPCGTINYTVSEDFTRITEYKHLTGQKTKKTTIMKEYSSAYTDPKTQIPYYAIINEENNTHYNKYKNLVDSMPNFYAIGRLAEYKYYNMDQIIEKAILLSKDILEKQMSDNTNKVISFAIPCYNSAEYMDNCIEHLLKLNSANDDVEILIIDDGSTKDDTLEIAKLWEKKFPNVVRAIHQENGGHGEAVNTGLKNAKGLYFKVVDSDDWLDFDGTMPIMDYIRNQAKGEPLKATDLVIGNYVYNKVHENSLTPINYVDALPEGREFGWDGIKKFKISEYLLMHSAIYRTQLLRDIKLKLPKHTFYVDNIFVYVPLPHVKSIYYINTNMYMYYIGREDQSVNEEVMKSRIDQQLKVTKIMIDATNMTELSSLPKLKRYMLNYLSMMMCICTIFLRMIGTKEADEKRKDIWEHLRAHDEKLCHKIMQSPLCYGTNIPGQAGKLIGTSGYKIAQKLFGFN